MPPSPEQSPEALPSNAITPLPIQLQPRRKRTSRTRQHLLKRRRRNPTPTNPHDNTSPTHTQHAKESEEKPANNDVNNDGNDDNDAAFATLSTLCDTHVAVLTLRAQWPGEAVLQLPRMPPLIPRSQIYALVADATVVDAELPVLVADGTLREIHIPSTKLYSRRDAYILSEDFKLPPPPPQQEQEQEQQNDVNTNTNTANTILAKFFTTVFDSCRHAVVDTDVLTATYGKDDVDTAISQLMRTGYLTFVDERTYAFAVPGMAEFLRHRRLGDTQIFKLLQSARYKEMPLQQLEMRSLKNTMFTAQWHVRDLVGSGLVGTVSTSVGILARLPHRRV